MINFPITCNKAAQMAKYEKDSTSCICLPLLKIEHFGRHTSS